MDDALETTELAGFGLQSVRRGLHEQLMRITKGTNWSLSRGE